MFRFGGFVIDGDLPPVDLPRADPPHDITVQRARAGRGDAFELQRWQDPRGRTWLATARTRGGYRVQMPELTCDLARDARAIVYEPAAGTSVQVTSHLLLHHVLPFALTRLGRLVLHACAVEIGGGTVAFVGPSGAGKSTLAEACCRRGFPLVADDALTLSFEEGRPIAWPTADGVRLWRGRDGIDQKAHLRVALAEKPAPLTRLYMIGTSYASVYVDPFEAATARLELLRHIVRLDVTDAGESRRVFDDAHALLDAVPMRWIMYPNGPAHLDAAVDALARDSISL